jgi:hypothetical protein
MTTGRCASSALCASTLGWWGELRTSDETKEVMCVDPEELEGMAIHPSMRLRIQHGLSEAAAPYIG